MLKEYFCFLVCLLKSLIVLCFVVVYVIWQRSSARTCTWRLWSGNGQSWVKVCFTGCSAEQAEKWPVYWRKWPVYWSLLTSVLVTVDQCTGHCILHFTSLGHFSSLKSYCIREPWSTLRKIPEAVGKDCSNPSQVSASVLGQGWRMLNIWQTLDRRFLPLQWSQCSIQTIVCVSRVHFLSVQCNV